MDIYLEVPAEAGNTLYKYQSNNNIYNCMDAMNQLLTSIRHCFERGDEHVVITLTTE